MCLQVDVETGQSCTFNEFVQQVKHLSDALWDLGLRHGDRILSCCKNNIDFPVLFFAVTKLGAVVSPCNPLFTPGIWCFTMLTRFFLNNIFATYLVIF